MRAITKILLMILLIAGIAAGALWAFQPPQRSSFYLWLAESSTHNASTEFAARFYEDSLKTFPQNADARRSAIDFYRSEDNYTKVEYHLLMGIQAEPGNTRYYKELSRAYVEQGKLFDAVDLLDHIKDPVVARIISSARPAPPVIAPESGFYRGSIEIVISAGDGLTIFCAKNGNYPVPDDVYTGVFSPDPGNTELKAVCVDRDGLVSSFASASYQLEAEVAAVQFEDPGVEKIIRSLINRPEGDISSGQLRTIREFSNMVGSDTVAVASLEDLKWCSDMDTLELTGVRTDSAQTVLNSLKYFPKIRVLLLRECAISDLSPISGIESLEYLDLTGNAITSIAGLSGLPTIERLILRNNSIVDISAVGALTSLIQLDIGINAISDISPIGTCVNLQSLALDSNKMTDITSFGSLERLTTLDISGNAIADISALAKNTALQTLNFSDNEVEILDALVSCVDLVSLTAEKNNISNIQPLGSLNGLNVIDLSENVIQNADALAGCSSLQSLNLSKNFLKDISPLAALQNLTELNIENNEITDLSRFIDSPALKTIYAFGNRIKDVEKLEDVAITVYK